MPRSSRVVPVFPRRFGIFHLAANLRAHLAVVQPFEHARAAALLHPGRHRLGEARAARDIWILIRRDLEPPFLRRLDEGDDFLHAAKIALAGDLQVEDVDRNSGAFADRDGFFDAFAQLIAVVPEMGRIKTAGGSRRLRQGDELVELRVGVRRIDESRRNPICSLRHGIGDERRHLLQLVGRRRPLRVVHDNLAHLAQADVRQQIHCRLRSFDGGEVAGEVGPVGCQPAAAQILIASF